MYFTLGGVTDADPALGISSPWFAMVRGSDDAKAVYATLLAAKSTGASVRITTSGSTVCGYAQVGSVSIP
jgi:hypothetical protein